MKKENNLQDEDKTIIDNKAMNHEIFEKIYGEDSPKEKTTPTPESAQVQAKKIIDNKDTNSKKSYIGGAAAAGLGLGVGLGTLGASQLMADGENKIENDELAENEAIDSAENLTDGENSTDTSLNDKEIPTYENTSFNEAFAAARSEQGPGGLFEWKGNLYGTYYVNEVDENMNPLPGVYGYDEQNQAQENTANSELENQPIENELLYDSTTETEPPVATSTANLTTEQNTDEEAVEVDINYIGVDTDEDGIVDVVFIDSNRDNEADYLIPVSDEGELMYNDAVALSGVANIENPEAENYQEGVMAIDTTGDGAVDIVIVDETGDHIVDQVYGIAPPDYIEDNSEFVGNDYTDAGIIEENMPDDVDLDTYEDNNGIAGLDDDMDDVSGFV
ncbi:MAG: hypothetical protein JJT94_13265 [Bernardetiaceae bacterium]|nr:hypothetical protein [Bernardetiaceae bacterium]